MANLKFKVGQLIRQEDIADRFYPEFSGICLVLSAENKISLKTESGEFVYYTILTPIGTKCDINAYLADRRFKAVDV